MRRKSQPFDPAFYLFVNYILRYFPICKNQNASQVQVKIPHFA